MKKKEWAPGIIVIVVIIGIVAGMRVSNHLRTFGLDKSVLQGEQNPDPEQTIRLCLYYVNRGQEEQANKLMLDGCETYEPKTLSDVKLLNVEPEANNSEQEQDFHVVYNWRTFWAPWWKDDRTNSVDFQLVQQDGVWKIKSIGNG